MLTTNKRDPISLFDTHFAKWVSTNLFLYALGRHFFNLAEILFYKLITIEFSFNIGRYIKYEIYFCYHIVANTNTCYYSENQIFDFLKSWILTCQKKIFRNKTFLFVVRISWNFVRMHEIPNHESSQNFSSIGQLLFLTPHVTNWINLN